MTPAAVLLVLALVAPPLVAAVTDAVDDDGPRPPLHLCGTAQGLYAPNSSYEANLRYLAAALPAKVLVSSSSSRTDVVVVEPPSQVYASAFCNRRPGDNSSGCAACLAKAFRYAQLLCPYHRHAMVDLRACRVSYHDAYRMEQDVAAIAAVDVVDDEHSSFWWLDYVLPLPFPTMLVFQVMGFACLLFMFLQEWRDSRRRVPADLQ